MVFHFSAAGETETTAAAATVVNINSSPLDYGAIVTRKKKLG